MAAGQSVEAGPPTAGVHACAISSRRPDLFTLRKARSLFILNEGWKTADWRVYNIGLGVFHVYSRFQRAHGVNSGMNMKNSTLCHSFQADLHFSKPIRICSVGHRIE